MEFKEPPQVKINLMVLGSLDFMCGQSDEFCKKESEKNSANCAVKTAYCRIVVHPCITLVVVSLLLLYHSFCCFNLVVVRFISWDPHNKPWKGDTP